MLETEDRQADLIFVANELRAIMKTMGNKAVTQIKFRRKLGKTSEAERQQDLNKLMGIATTPKRGGQETP